MLCGEPSTRRIRDGATGIRTNVGVLIRRPPVVEIYAPGSGTDISSHAEAQYK